MSPLAWFLLAILLLSTACFLLLGQIAAASGGKRPYKYLLIGYVWLVGITLGGLVMCFIGPGRFHSPMIATAQQRRIAHTGYYFARDGDLKLLGKSAADAPPVTRPVTLQQKNSQQLSLLDRLRPDKRMMDRADGAAADIIEDGFTNSVLASGEKIVVKPRWEADTASTWDISYKAASKPLRFESRENGRPASRCVNLPEENWLGTDDALVFTIERGNETQFVEIRLSVGSRYFWPFTRVTNQYYFSRGVITEGRLDYNNAIRNVLISETRLIDGFGLGNLIKRARPEARKSVGTIDNEWLNVFDGVTLVREFTRDLNSRIGVLLASDLAAQSGVRVYKNYRDQSSTPLILADRDVSAVISSATKISYGLGNSKLELKLSERIFDDEIWGQVVRVSFDSPEMWPLPPVPTDDFIITTTNDYIPLDGYLLDIGNSAHAFYAKATLSEDLNTLSINDGKNVDSDEQKKDGANEPEVKLRMFPLDVPASLGDFQQGVLIALVEAQGAVPYTGLIAIGLLLANCLTFTYFAWNSDKLKPKLNLAWVLMWSFLLTILVVRLVLVFRVSLLPPGDATGREIENVFNKGVKYAIAGMIACLLLAFVPEIVRLSRWLWTRLWTGGKISPSVQWMIVTWGLVIILWGLLGRYFGSNQALFGLRINIAIHLLIVGGLIVLARGVVDAGRRVRAMVCLIVVIALAVQIWLVGDAGSIIYGLSLGVCVWLMLFWSNTLPAPRRWTQRLKMVPLVIGSVFPLIMMSVLLFLIPLFLPYLTQISDLKGNLLPAFSSTIYYRLASFTDTEENVLTARSGDRDADLGVLLDNSLQNWQMLLYASQGVSDSKGYGNVSLSRRGMTYPTSMADCVFSTHLLAEHGLYASLFLLMIYVALGFVCVLAGWRLPGDLSHRNIPLLAIGGFFICNAFYMAAANIGLTVFTGQNIPLLALNSGSDLVQGIVLVGLAGYLLLSCSTEASARFTKVKHPMAFWIVLTFFAGAFMWLIVIGNRMSVVGATEAYRHEHNFKPDVFKAIREHLPPADGVEGKSQNAPWRLNGDQLVKMGGGEIQEVEKQYIKQFNERVDKYNPLGGLYYLEDSSTPGNPPLVRVNDTYFRTRSPFDEAAMWRGTILAAGDSQPILSSLGTSLAISLKQTGHPGSVDLKKTLPVLVSQSVLLVADGIQFCEIKRETDRLRLDAKGRHTNDWMIYVNGKRVTEGIDLEPLSIIVIENREKKFRRNLIYLGFTPPTLAYVRWRNGEQRRMFPESGFPLAYLMGKAGDAATTAEKGVQDAERKMRDRLQLNIDLPLQQRLQTELARYAAVDSVYDPKTIRPNRLAVTVLDAFTGRTLALPSWPILDPNKREYEKLIDKIPESLRLRFEYNHNFTNHVAGSTFKPLVYTTMASALWSTPFRGSSGFDLARITVNNSAERATESAPATDESHLHWSIGKLRLDEAWDCNSTEASSDMSSFLIKSRDYPQGVLGMMGMVTNAAEIGRVLIPSQNRADVIYNGQNYIFDLTKASENATAFTIDDQLSGNTVRPRGPEILQSSVLYRGLSTNFDFGNQPTQTWLSSACSTFVPMFANERLKLDENNYLDNIVPGQIDLGRGDFQYVRGGIISCLLGAGDCLFNNVRMAEAAARLATGQRIFAQIENYPDRVNDQMPEPLGNSQWRNANIISPLQKVGEVGTAGDLRSLVALPAEYRAIYKTGTVLEGDNKENREGETLLFVIGRWQNNAFVPGETIAGYVYMEKAKAKDIVQKKKFVFSAPILKEIIRYLVERRAAG